MKILSSFTQLQVVLNLYDFLYYTKNKRRYYEECLFFLLWKSMGSINCLVTDILQNIFFCVQQKKENHTGLKQLEGE